VAFNPSASQVSTQNAKNLDWNGLHEAVTNCRACSLSQLSAQYGVWHGLSACARFADASHAIHPVDWLIVGEAPGENEDVEGEPFVGQAGRLLDNMLRAMQLSRTGELSDTAKPAQSIFITNVLKCRLLVTATPRLKKLRSACRIRSAKLLCCNPK
jgi:DNA polymerase